MKNIFLVFSICFFALQQVNAQDPAYKLDIQVEGLKDSVANLTFFYGHNHYYKDTASIDEEGKFTFKGSEPLDPGLFSIFYGKEKLFDFFVTDDPFFSIKTEKDDLVQSLDVEGSEENEIFFEYLKFLKEKQDEAADLIAMKDTNNPESEENKKIEEELDELDRKVSEFIEDFKKEHPKSFTVKFLNSLEYPDIPKTEPGEKIDSAKQLLYLRAHIFDNIDFSDPRSVRIPSYHERLNYFLEKLTYPIPDSVIASLDYILGKASQNQEVLKYTLNYATQKYERSNQMGMDKVFVYLVNNYFKKDKAPWVDEKQMKKIIERAETLEPLLIGKKAPNIVVKDTSQKKFVQLYDVDAKYTIVYIWSPECGYCKVSTPKLQKLYKKYKDDGVEVFAVGNEFENEAWIKYIREHNLEWINGSDGGDFRSNFRYLYDVYSTPTTYLLDENKIIVSKKMNIESLDKILEFELKKNKKKEESTSDENQQ